MTQALRIATTARARRVSRRLATRGLPGLGDALVRLRGRTIGDAWRIDTLYAVGAEGAVFTTTNLAAADDAPTVVKIPLLPYHRPADISSDMLRHRRDALRTEACYLAAAASPFMPKDCGLHEFANPLLDPSRDGPFADPDPALVMERLPGLDVDLWLARVHHSGLAKSLLRERLDAVAVMLLEALRDLEMRGFFYADLRPGNLRVTGRPERRLRLLDAGSLVEVGDASGRYPHVPHYLPPDLFERRYLKDLPLVPSSAAQAVMAGRTLYEIATGRVPVPGRPLDPADLKDCGVSAVVADAIDGLGSGSFSSVVPTLRYITRHRTVHAVRAVRANVHADVPRPEPALQLAESSDASRPAMGSAVAPGAARPGIPVAVPAVAAPAPAVSSSSTAPVPRRAVSAPTISASTPAPLATAPASAANRPAPASRGLWRRLVERATSWRVRRTHAPTARPSATPN